MRRALTLAVVALVTLGGVAPSEAARGKKRAPIRKTYPAYADKPDPTNVLYDVGGVKPAPDRFPYTACEGTVPDSRHVYIQAVRGAGQMVVDLDLFNGDWDIVLLDAHDRQISAPNQGNKGWDDPLTGSNEGIERISYRAPRAMTIKIVACNRVGTSGVARVTFTFTYR